ncbi:MAG: Gfo/Idh/MocA family oxidoreductase [Planctomycetota bacterium]
MAQSKKRYAVVGVSNRGIYLFLDQILNIYSNHAELAAVIDKDRSRMEQYNNNHKVNIPSYLPEEFDKMVRERRPDVVVVCCHDAMHHHYVIKSLEHNLDVICEKPLTIDEDKCSQIAAAAASSKGNVQVTFNYRYTPYATKIKELIAQGKVGKVVSADLTWYLDTHHGSSYFQRWNRLREMSGGLSVHKASHHFDVINWWIGQKAAEVFAYGALNFYGPKGVHNPLKREQIGDGRICPTCDMRDRCKYYMRWNRSEFRSGRTGEKIDDHIDFAQEYEDYSPRQCIFDPQINIEDTYAAVFKYDGGAFLNYSLNGSVPYEGFRVAINGTEGRIEFFDPHGGARMPYPVPTSPTVTYIPMFGGRELIDLINLGGGHGGGDPLLSDELFIGPDPLAPVNRQASLEDGINAVLMGTAVRKSVDSGKVVSIEQMRRKIYSK